MSLSQRSVSRRSEGIDGVGRRLTGQVGFQSLAVHDINGLVEQGRNIFLKPYVTPDPDMRLGIDLNHNIDVAVRPVVAACARAEQRGMTDAPRAQSRFVFPQPGKDFLTVHLFMITSAAQLC